MATHVLKFGSPPPFQNKTHKVIQQLARKQVRKLKKFEVGTLVTEPTLKSILGPDAISPLQPGDDLESDPNAVLAWFADVRLSTQAGGALLKDCIVATQARANIGQAGSPVTVLCDPTSGRYEITGRADRVTSFQSVKSYTTLALGVGFVKGHRVSGGEVVSPFYQYFSGSASVLTATDANGHRQAGLNRGIAGWSGGQPVANYNLGVTITTVPFGSLDFGTDALGVLYETTYNRDGSTSTVKRNP